MTLYESNYLRLGWLVPDLRRLTGALLSAVPGQPALELAVREQCRYTTALGLSYVFDDGGEPVREPGLEVRVYHDARLAEACGVAAHPQLRRLAAAIPRDQGQRWSNNMLLNKWLEYCVGGGHRFVMRTA